MYTNEQSQIIKHRLVSPKKRSKSSLSNYQKNRQPKKNELRFNYVITEEDNIQFT